MIRRSTLRAQVTVALRDEILAGRLPTGRDFTVKEIAESYGVSATPVREALVDLAAQGLLDTEHHRGFRVHTFTPEDFRALLAARALVLEGLHRTPPPWPEPAALACLRHRAETAQQAAETRQLDVLIGYDLRYWRELGTHTGNPYLRDFLDRLRVQAWAFQVPHLRSRPDLPLWSGHVALLDAMAARDAEAARKLFASHEAHALDLADALTPPGGSRQ